VILLEPARSKAHLHRSALIRREHWMTEAVCAIVREGAISGSFD
jgi:hypothetical protein